MENMIVYIIVLCLILFGIALAASYEWMQQKAAVKGHLKVIASVEEITTKKQSRFGKILAKILVYADQFSDIGERFNFYSESEDVKKWLIQANHPLDLSVKRFQGLKIILMVLSLFLGMVAFIIRFPLGEFMFIILPFVGFFLPIIFVKRAAKKRQENLSYDLPDFLDMVSVSLKAGASLDQAFREISSYFEGPIREEFFRFNQRAQLGIPREELYQELIERTDVAEFQMVIKSLIRGAQLGVPVATTFEIQSVEIRKLRKERAKELAAKASPKVTMVTTFIVMPTAFILIGGMVLLNIIYKIGDSGITGMF